MGKFLNQYEILFRKAKGDLSAAKILYSHFIAGGELDIDIIYFHLQQCAEKLIKAVLSANEIHFPRIHDLEELLNIAKDHYISLNLDTVILIELNDFAVEGRYSIIHDDIADFQKYFALLHNLMDTTTDILTS
jgi:HEPN domain-containing protein